MADRLYLGKTKVTPAIVKKEEVVPGYVPPKVIVNGVLKNPDTATSYSTAPATDVGAYALYCCFYENHNLTSVDLSSLTTVSGYYAMYTCFAGCNNITSVDLSSLTTVSGQYVMSDCFNSCTKLTSVDLSSLTTVSGYSAMNQCFQYCHSLTSVDLSSLTTVSGGYAMGSCFQNCGALKTVYMPRISSADYASRETCLTLAFVNSPIEVLDMRYSRECGKYGYMDNLMNGVPTLRKLNINSLEYIGLNGARAFLFVNAGTSVQPLDVKFPMLTRFGDDPFYTNAFGNRQNVSLHFRKDMQSTVENLPNYSILFGASTGSSIIFDLIGTITGVNGNVYTRSELDSVYESETAGADKTATGWKNGDNIYYTAGEAEPTIGTAIYSDPKCSIMITTVSDIA